MRYFYDTEFLEDGHTIDLISIGIVADDGREFYAVNDDAATGGLYEKIRRHRWLMLNVVPSLPLKSGVVQPHGGDDMPGRYRLDLDSNTVMPRRMIRNAVRDFLLSAGEVELWADYGAYDHVALCQLFGPMMLLPPGLPMFTNEFQQAWNGRGRPELPDQPSGVHNALEDARHLRSCFDSVFRPSEPVWNEPPAKIEKTWGDAP